MNLKDTHTALLDHALRYPEAWEDHPWGERVIQVRTKASVFSGMHEDHDGFRLSLELPLSASGALAHAEASPTGDGLGRHGWVSFADTDPEAVPRTRLQEWIEESDCAVAPKSLARARMRR